MVVCGSYTGNSSAAPLDAWNETGNECVGREASAGTELERTWDAALALHFLLYTYRDLCVEREVNSYAQWTG